MSKVEFTNVTVALPVFNATGRSITSKLLSAISYGKLDKDAKGHVSVTALKSMNFKVESGDRVGIIGSNGAGKSTLLRTISEIYKPSLGSVSVEGSVGTLIDISLGINPEATGRENIFIRGMLLGIPKKQILEKFEEIAEFSELGPFIDMPVRTYSSGMLMRLGFSVSTILKQDILLMDEWLSVGDEKFKLKAEAKLIEMFETTKILFLATHSRQLVESICNKALWLAEGEIKMFGEAGSVCAAYFDN